jgi:hypothetical protein
MAPELAGLRAAPPRGHAAWSWRGLLWALLLALVMHISLVFVLQTNLLLHGAKLESGGVQVRLIDAPASATPSPGSPQTALGAPNRVGDIQRGAPARLAQELAHAVADRATAPSHEEKSALALASSEKDAIKNEVTHAASLASSPLSPAGAPAGAAAALAAPAVASLQYPPSVSLEFEGVFMNRGQERRGTGSLKWATDGQNYDLRLQASALIVLSRQETSVGQITPMGLAPRRYSSARTGRSEQATHFLRDTGKIQFSANKPPAVLLAGAQDRLSVLLQLAAGFAGDPALAQRVERVAMQVAGPDSAELWEFKLEGQERLVLPAGEIEALKLSRVHRHEYDANLHLWLAPKVGFLPVRIVQSSRTAAEQDFTELLLRVLP